jgi:hypothetical protein
MLICGGHIHVGCFEYNDVAKARILFMCTHLSIPKMVNIYHSNGPILTRFVAYCTKSCCLQFDINIIAYYIVSSLCNKTISKSFKIIFLFRISFKQISIQGLPDKKQQLWFLIHVSHCRLNKKHMVCTCVVACIEAWKVPRGLTRGVTMAMGSHFGNPLHR